MTEGDDAAQRATRLMAVTLVIALAFLLGALAQAFRRRSRALLVLGWAAVGTAAVLAVVLGAAT